MEALYDWSHSCSSSGFQQFPRLSAKSQRQGYALLESQNSRELQCVTCYQSARHRSMAHEISEEVGCVELARCLLLPTSSLLTSNLCLGLTTDFDKWNTSTSNWRRGYQTSVVESAGRRDDKGENEPLRKEDRDANSRSVIH